VDSVDDITVIEGFIYDDISIQHQQQPVVDDADRLGGTGVGNSTCAGMQHNTDVR
jgi:hypothetical protein